MICSCPLCNRRIAASLPLFGTVQKCLGCGAKIRIPGEQGGPAELVEKWLGGEFPAPEAAKTVVPEAAPAAWAPIVAATGAGPVVALPQIPASAVAASAPPEAFHRPSPADPVRPPRPAASVPAAPPEPAASMTTAELPARSDTDAIIRPAMGMHPLKRNLLALGGVVLFMGAVVAILFVRGSAANRAKADPAQASALKFNDALAEADAPVHASCSGFVTSVERWLDGQALDPAAIQHSRDAAMRDADDYGAKVRAMNPPDSDEGRAFHRKAIDLSEAYKELTGVAFAEVVRRIGEGGRPIPADFDRVEMLVAHGDSKIVEGQRALVEAQQVFAKKYSILLAPKK